LSSPISPSPEPHNTAVTPVIRPSPPPDGTLVAYPTRYSQLSRPIHLIPEITRKLAGRAWKQVVKDWDEADPARSHYVALKDWDRTWHRDRKESAKYGQRQMIALEFIDWYGLGTLSDHWANSHHIALTVMKMPLRLLIQSTRKASPRFSMQLGLGNRTKDFSIVGMAGR